MREFRREDGLTYQLPFEYQEGANCEFFQEYLDRVLPDKDLQDILAEFIGYIFTKDLKLEKCLLLYGNGANGKSVFFEIINALLGSENVSNFSLGHLAEEHNRALIATKLLNYGSEIKGGINSDIFKQLASGEPVQCRMKYGNSFMIRDYARLCFNCNELPREVEHTEAFFRRFLIIPFEVTIPEEERDPELAVDIITYELQGVFNWVLEGLKRLLFNRNFTYSEKVQQTVTTYKQQSDSVHLFLEEENFHPSAANYLQASFVYPLYRAFCQNDGYRPLGKTRFNKRLRERGFNIDRRNSGYIIFMEKQKIETRA
jgi:putative DNA primase/helicase